MLYYTGDLHFGKQNAYEDDIKDNSALSRLFTCEDEREALITARWNETVSDDDDVYVLGDVSDVGPYETAVILKGLNGRKHVLEGNHDKFDMQLLMEYDCGVAETGAIKSLYDDSQYVTLCHYPILEWPWKRRGAYMLYAHTHGGTIGRETRNTLGRYAQLTGCSECRAFNVGCMIHDFKPVTLEQLKAESGVGENWRWQDPFGIW